jgi:flagellar hook protein FlgE
MFILRDADNNGEYYSRAGQFEFDNVGNLVNQDGLEVQGRAINTDGSMGPVGTITIPADLSPPNPTSEIVISMNLDSSAAVGETFDTTVTTYDSLGNSVELTMNFQRTADGWAYYVSSSSGDVDNGAGFDPADVTTWPSEICFDVNGAYSAADSTPATTSHDITIQNLDPADTPMTISWMDLDTTVTGYAGTSVKTAQTQNGFPSGLLQSISVDDDGIFSALYSNGTVTPFAQILLADFASYTGLSKQGGNLYTSTLASGQAVQIEPNSAGVGSIAPSSLEMSNVDLATEFVELITTQRGFQANSKVITTSDEVLSDLINIKR